MSKVVANETLFGKWVRKLRCLGEMGGQMHILALGLLLVECGKGSCGTSSSFGGTPTKYNKAAPTNAEKNDR